MKVRHATQERIQQLVAFAALQQAARTRYLKATTSPLQHNHRRAGLHHASRNLAHPTSPGPRTPSLVFRLRHFLRQYNSSVVPSGSQTRNAVTVSNPPHERGRLLGKPLAPLDEQLNFSAEPISPATQESILHPICTQPASNPVAAKQSACRSDHLESSFVQSPPRDIIRPASREEVEEVSIVEQDILNAVPQLLENVHLCQNVLVRQLGCVQRTMLACEGIAINCLFDHGTPTSRVCISILSACLSDVAPAKTVALTVFSGAQIIFYHAGVLGDAMEPVQVRHR
jgi:hypothetical protein